MIRKLSLDDDLKHVAELIYETAIDIFDDIFKSKKTFIHYFTELIQLESSNYSYNNIYCYLDNGKIKGIVIINDYKNKKIDTSDFIKVFGLFKALYYGTKAYKLLSITTSDNKECYIDHICVDKKHRGEGIGSHLLDYAFDYARNSSCDYIYLDVALDNSKAKKLYERVGFVVYCKNKLKGDSAHGVYGMEKNL